MKRVIQIILVSAVVIGMAFGIRSGCGGDVHAGPIGPAAHVKSVAELPSLFPTTAAEITKWYERALEDAKERLKVIMAVPAEERTFDNTILTLDRLGGLSDLVILSNVCTVLEVTSTDKAVRDTAHDTSLKISAFFLDKLANNKPLYEAFKAYAHDKAPHEDLDEEQQYFIEESLKGFKRAGLDLSDVEREQLVVLKKELTQLSSEFERSIASDNRTIEVTRNELQGLDDDFINALKQTDKGLVVLGVDYPTYFAVMEKCDITGTRQKLSDAFKNRGYPCNHERLAQIIAKRDQLAHMLGYESYADFDIEEQMVGSTAKVRAFLDDLLAKSRTKEDEEFAELTQDLPESVIITDGRLNPWDGMYLGTYYKKKRFDLDEQKISEYFPMEKTVEGLLEVYRKFLSLEFKQLPNPGLWHDEVRVVEVSKAGQEQPLGYLMLDLFPRENKYSHACHATVVPAVNSPDEKTVGISAVLANFPRASGDKPALLKRDDVKTFFHEFGHALHALLGATKMSEFAGTSVKRDFVELPSQMLEEWLDDREILRMVSGHYKTGEPLPDAEIDKILALKKFGCGMFVQRQAFLSRVSLDCFAAGEKKDPYELYQGLYSALRRHVHSDPDDHMYANFGHLTGYGAKYYGYLWSKVFALDMFEQIKQEGLLNPETGARYIREVIGRGGSAHPNELLRGFLGREPRSDAFFRDMGLEV